MRPIRPSTRERFRARNGPPIDDWEIALIGREVIKENAADGVSNKSLRATLNICARKAQGALKQLPVEVLLQIEQILHDSVSIPVPHHVSSPNMGNIRLTNRTLTKL